MFERFWVWIQASYTGWTWHFSQKTVLNNNLCLKQYQKEILSFIIIISTAFVLWVSAVSGFIITRFLAAQLRLGGQLVQLSAVGHSSNPLRKLGQGLGSSVSGQEIFEEQVWEVGLKGLAATSGVEVGGLVRAEEDDEVHETKARFIFDPRAYLK